MARVLITGGAGFVGSHLVSSCVQSGDEVHVVIRPSSNDQRLRHLGDGIIRHAFDLRSSRELKRCLADVNPNVIFHLAASPRLAEKSHLADATENIRGCLECLVTLLACAADTPHTPARLIRTGSLAEYGSAPTPHREEVREMPVNVYSAGLVAAAHYVNALQPRLPFPVATARLALVYGPSQSTDYLLPSLVTRCLAGERSIVHQPMDRRDLIFVKDAVAALRLMADTALPGGTVVNVASGVAPTMRELAELVIDTTGASPRLVEYGDDSLPTGASDLRPVPERAHTLLGWRARTALAAGVEQTVRWYRERAILQKRLETPLTSTSLTDGMAGVL